MRRRALKYALVASSAFIVVFSSLVTTFEYGNKSAMIDREIANVREVQNAGIVEALWSYETNVLQALVDGFRFYPYIEYVDIVDGGEIVVASGERAKGAVLQSFPLRRYSQRGGGEEIGALRIEVDSQRILLDVLAGVFLSVVFQVIFVIIESLLITYLFSTMVTKPLAQIAEYIEGLDAKMSAPPLSIDKEHSGDEFDLLVRSFNAMRENLADSRASELKVVEELKMSEELNRVLVEEAPDAILMYDLENGFLTCNRRAESLFGRSSEEILRMRPVELYGDVRADGLPIEESIAASTARAIEGGTVLVQRRIRRPDGDVLTCEVRLTRIPAEGKRIMRVSCIDISDRIAAEEAMSRSLREKDVLLQEVYHRTKNNMQLIASLLSLEAASCGDERSSEILSTMIGRIMSMSLVHQKLYESKDLSRIDLGEYIEDLVGEIGKAYLEGRTDVGIVVNVESGIVSLIDVAIPCGLMLNELIVNAVKHGFPGDRGGSITVSMKRSAPGLLELSVADDGIGLPSGFDFRRDGKIGLQTVVSIVELQLHGKVYFDQGHGTVCRAIVRDNIFTRRV